MFLGIHIKTKIIYTLLFSFAALIIVFVFVAVFLNEQKLKNINKQNEKAISKIKEETYLNIIETIKSEQYIKIFTVYDNNISSISISNINGIIYDILLENNINAEIQNSSYTIKPKQIYLRISLRPTFEYDRFEYITDADEMIQYKKQYTLAKAIKRLTVTFQINQQGLYSGETKSIIFYIPDDASFINSNVFGSIYIPKEYLDDPDSYLKPYLISKIIDKIDFESEFRKYFLTMFQ